MPPGTDSGVNIVINVIDGATGEVVSRITKSFDQLGDAGARNGQKVEAGMKEAGAAGEAAGRKIEAGMKHASEHSLTALDNVRLLRDDLGIRIPRAMEKVISQSALAMGAIGAIGGGLVALGGIQVLLQLGEQAYHFYQKMTDVNAEMRKFADEAGKNADQKLFNTSSIEEVNALLAQTGQRMAELDQKRKGAGVGVDNRGSIEQYFDKYVLGGNFDRPIYTKVNDKERAELAGKDNLLEERKHAINSKRAVDLQEAKATEEGMRLTGRAADSAAARNAETLAHLKRQQEVAEAVYARDARIASNRLITAQNPGADADKLYEKGVRPVSFVAKDLGAQDEGDAIAKARAEAGAKGGRQSQEEREEARHATAEAGMAGLGVEELALAQMQEKLKQLQEKAKKVGMDAEAYRALREAITKTARDEQTKRMREEDERSSEMEAGARGAGLTGLAKLDFDRDQELAKQQREAAAGKFTNVDTLNRNAAGINLKHDTEAGQQTKTFTDRIAQLDAGRSDHYASEDDRIRDSAQKTVTEITEIWTKMYGGLGPLDARRVETQQALNDEIAKINADAAKQRQEAGQRVEGETRKLEDQAGRQGLPKYQRETAAIVDDYNERIAKLEELRGRDAANADKYRRQEVAEEQIKNGKLIEQRRQLEEQLAGKLKGLLNNPLEALKSFGEDQASKILAHQIFKLNPAAATAFTGETGKGGGAFGLPAIFGSGWGGKHPAHADAGASQAGSGTHNDNPQARTIGYGNNSSASAELTATNAVIHITGTASFPGGSAAGGRAAAGTRPGGGSYAPTGNGGYFNTGQADAGSSLGQITAEAGGPSVAGSASGSASSGAYDEAGASASTRIEAGISEAKTVGSDAQSISNSLGKDAGASLQNKLGISDEMAGKIGGAAGGALGVFSAFEGKGGVSGALSGAVSGAQLGAQFGGPLGAAVGGIVGGIAGFIGHGARVQAQKYNFKTVRPRLAGDLSSFEAGQMDYQSAYDDLTNLITEAKVQTRQMGPGAVSYYKDTIQPELKTGQERLTREQKSGRSQFGMAAAQFHQGGMIRDFGSMATTDGQGWVHAKRGEIMLSQQAAMSHADAAMLMNAGASRSEMAGFYGGGGTQAAEPSGGVTNLHFHAPDAKGMYQLFMDNKHHIRSAVNASAEENSGGGDYA